MATVVGSLEAPCAECESFPLPLVPIVLGSMVARDASIACFGVLLQPS